MKSNQTGAWQRGWVLVNAVIIITVVRSCMTSDNSILTWGINVFIHKVRGRYSLFRMCSEDFGLHLITHHHFIHFTHFLGVSHNVQLKKGSEKKVTSTVPDSQRPILKSTWLSMERCCWQWTERWSGLSGGYHKSGKAPWKRWVRKLESGYL